eukprot:GHRR01029829.1.p1 GENE.GHRR01029829.1~~GHRR01029829.1.p1  ORF type:complete len:219 (+),score=88.54 GHRR01029829.1:406-1062(+)
MDVVCGTSCWFCVAAAIRAAQTGLAAAKRRLASSQAAIKAQAAAMEAAEAAEQAHKREALLALKGKIDEVRDNIGVRADKFRQLQKQKREQEKHEFEALQEQGINPYEVYRRRDAEAAAAKAAADLAAGQAQRRAAIAAAIAEEENSIRKSWPGRSLTDRYDARQQEFAGSLLDVNLTDWSDWLAGNLQGVVVLQWVCKGNIQRMPGLQPYIAANNGY